VWKIRIDIPTLASPHLEEHVIQIKFDRWISEYGNMQPCFSHFKSQFVILMFLDDGVLFQVQ
jgi:hypothetical protein